MRFQVKLYNLENPFVARLDLANVFYNIKEIRNCALKHVNVLQCSHASQRAPWKAGESR